MVWDLMSRNCSYKRIYEDVRRKIDQKEYSDGEKLPTEAELQKIYGVSRITVIKALEPLRKEGLIQSFPGKGTFVHLSERHNEPVLPLTEEKPIVIGVVMPQIYSYFGNAVLTSIAEEANKRGIHLMAGFCYSTVEEETQQIERLMAFGCAGIIVIPLRAKSINHGIISALMKNYPVVVVDRELEGVPLTYVGSDHEQAAAEAMEYLFSLGHKNIGMVSTVPKTTAITARERGYFYGYAMTKYQVRLDNCVYDIHSSMSRADSEAEIRGDVDRMKDYFLKNQGISALLCVNYNTMQVCRIALRELGLQIPRDVSLVCFDAPKDVIARKEHTYVQQNEQEIGRQAVDAVLKLIRHETEAPQRYLIPSKLCIGASTDAPRK